MILSLVQLEWAWSTIVCMKIWWVSLLTISRKHERSLSPSTLCLFYFFPHLFYFFYSLSRTVQNKSNTQENEEENSRKKSFFLCSDLKEWSEAKWGATFQQTEKKKEKKRKKEKERREKERKRMKITVIPKNALILIFKPNSTTTPFICYNISKYIKMCVIKKKI